MCLDTCSNSSWQYHLTCAITFDPTHFAMVTISFLSPPSLPPSLLPYLPPSRPHPRPLSFVWLAWIKVPMMHGATTTSNVSSASTPVTNVPFAESAASNQVCSFTSVLSSFSSAGSESLYVRLQKLLRVESHTFHLLWANEWTEFRKGILTYKTFFISMSWFAIESYHYSLSVPIYGHTVYSVSRVSTALTEIQYLQDLAAELHKKTLQYFLQYFAKTTICSFLILLTFRYDFPPVTAVLLIVYFILFTSSQLRSSNLIWAFFVKW